MSFLGLENQTVVVFGVANKKSVGYAIGKVLRAAGARVAYVVHTQKRKEEVSRAADTSSVYVCDVERKQDILHVAEVIGRDFGQVDGLVHSIAFANYSEGMRPFHETPREDFLQAIQVSCHSLLEISEAFRPLFSVDASVVTISISSTAMAAENYGYMAPVKAALDSSVVFLAKSFSKESHVRFNAVCAGLLKTSSSAGIPGYVESYLFAERATLRKKALLTSEVADVASFLLSPRSSGINGQRLVVDAGMGVNYFDKEIVSDAMRPRG